MKRIFAIISGIIWVGFLTLITQVGGVVWLITLPVWFRLRKRITSQTQRKRLRPIFFLSTYLLVSTLVIPPLARQWGRVPLPVFSSEKIRPLNYGFCLLNRHYVRPELRKAIINVGDQLDKEYPGSVLAYLDGNFPFYDGFPLLPHISHSDGQKLDVALFFKDAQNYQPVNREALTWMGYGGSEEPRTGEVNTTQLCEQKGYWQYGLMSKVLPLWGKDRLTFDQERTKTLIQLFARYPTIGKILLEPHLKTRMGLKGYDKVRFHGCHAVRHDDHIHVQL